MLIKFGNIQILEIRCTHLKEGFINESEIGVFPASGCYVDPLLIASSHMKILALRPCTKRHLPAILFVKGH